MKSGGALAVFVKTPGLSPVKTRLAATIGREPADQFYRLAIAATQAVAEQLQETTPELQAYWAVAEAEGMRAPVWKDFPRLFQGEGSLGERLGRVYDQLLHSYGYVCFLGADSPHLLVSQWQDAITRTSKQENFVLGETLDGGFYFFGGSKPIPSELWQTIMYSSDQTSIQLKSALEAIAPVELVDRSFDIDNAEDLLAYRSLLLSDFLPEQRNVITWAQTLK